MMRWYLQHKRELPWRATRDPYKIWLSEIILQQTRVAQGLPYYIKFVAQYPTVKDLAEADEEDVLRLWQGLGYYSRARNLHHCAKFVSNALGGKFPNTYDQLITLKGVGSYTAAAIASIAFGQAVPTIDGNVFRVLSRILGIEVNIADQKNRGVFFDSAKELMGDNNPEVFNQAIMEYGALQCVPRNPKCQDCVISDNCYAFANNKQDSLPINNKRIKIRNRYFNYVVFSSENDMLVRKRSAGDIWEGLYDFYNLEVEQLMSEEDLVSAFSIQIADKITITSVSRDYKHILTHQRINARFYTIEINDLNFVETIRRDLGLQLVSKNSLEGMPKPRLIDRFLADEKIT